MAFDWNGLSDAIQGVGGVVTTYRNTRATVQGAGGTPAPVVSASTVQPSGGGLSMSSPVILGALALVGVVLAVRLAKR